MKRKGMDHKRNISSVQPPRARRRGCAPGSSSRTRPGSARPRPARTGRPQSTAAGLGTRAPEREDRGRCRRTLVEVDAATRPKNCSSDEACGEAPSGGEPLVAENSPPATPRPPAAGYRHTLWPGKAAAARMPVYSPVAWRARAGLEASERILGPQQERAPARRGAA